MNLAINKMKKIIAILSLVLFCIFQSCSSSDSGKKIELIPVATEEKFGYIDREGNMIINPQFAKALPFSFGKALILPTGEKQNLGYIDETGKIVINAQFKQATSFSEGIAWTVKESGAPEAIDENGTPLFKVLDAERVYNYSEGMACYSIVDKEGTNIYGYLDKDGKTVIQPQFYDAGSFKESMAAVKNKEGQWGYINKDGKIEINHQFDEANNFKNNLAVVKSGENYGIIGKDGKFTVNPQFSYIVIESNGDLLIAQEGKAGWADSDGKIFINPQFDFASGFINNKIAPVKSGDKYGYINKEGKYEINPQFEDATPFNYGIAIVKSNNKYGIIDEDGKFIVNPQFKEIDKNAMNTFYGFGLESQYVETDYFDISGLVSNLKKNVNSSTIYKISTNLTVGEINNIYNLSENDYYTYETTKKIIDTSFKDISEIDVSFSASPKSYYGFDSNIKPTSVSCEITLKGKASKKATLVYEEFKKFISSIGAKYYEGKSYTNNNLYSVKNGNSILIITTDNQNNISVIQMNQSEVLLDAMKSNYGLSLSSQTNNSGLNSSNDTFYVVDTLAPSAEMAPSDS